MVESVLARLLRNPGCQDSASTVMDALQQVRAVRVELERSGLPDTNGFVYPGTESFHCRGTPSTAQSTALTGLTNYCRLPWN